MPKTSNGISFIDATDLLFTPVTHTELASALGLSRSRIAQARLSDLSTGKRPPPEGWEKAVLALARKKLAQLETLVEALRKHQ